MIRTRRGKTFFCSLIAILFCSPNLIYSRQNISVDFGRGIDANRLAHEVVENELNAQTRDRTLWKYRESQDLDGKQQVFEVVQTESGEIHQLLAVNGKPLTSKERATENHRIQKLLTNQEEWQEKQKDHSGDAKRARTLLTMLPAAFLYQYDGTQGGLIRLRFGPNPNFHPKSREGQVFHHMEGVFWVEPKQKRLAELDGHLLNTVKFGGGLLGHLNAGGTFSVRQKDVGFGHWEMTSLEVKMDGKVMFFKTIAVREKQVFTKFEPVPNGLSLEQAAEILERDTAS